MKDRSPSIPDSAFDGTPFRTFGGGVHPAEAVRVERPDTSLWAAILDDPDKAVPRRTWVTEVSVGRQHGRVAFGARLLNVSRGDDPPFEPSRPALIRQLLSKHFAIADGRRLREEPEYVESRDDVLRFVELLSDGTRRLPIIAVARTRGGAESVSPERLARQVSGIAHVYVIDEESSWELTRILGKSLSVFLGATRIYNRGFDPKSADPFDHPLWLLRDLNDIEGARLRLRQVAGRLFGQSVRSLSEIDGFPRFDEVRQIAAADEREAARAKGGSDAELLALYQLDNEALRSEIERRKAEQEEAQRFSNEIIEMAERERDEARSEAFGLRSRIQILETAIKGRGIAISVEPLGSYEEIDDWAKKYLSGHIWIAPKAIRETEKNGAFEDIGLFQKTLLVLKDCFVPMKKEPSTEKFEFYRAQLQNLGIEDQRCFSQPGAISAFPEYAVTYDSRKYWCEDHIKYGGGYDARFMFRIYYHWHSEDQILLIGHMPTHLDNKRTN